MIIVNKMTENESDRCSRAMGCDGVRCIWDASKHKCAGWCKAHAEKWVPSLMAALDNVTDARHPALFTIDKLIFEGKKGAFIRGTKDNVQRLVVDQVPSKPFTKEDLESIEEEVSSTRDLLSDGKLNIQIAKLTICGLGGNPDEKVLEEWETHFTHIDLLEFTKFKGYAKRVITVERVSTMGMSANNYMVSMFDGKTEHITRDQASAVVSAALSDPRTKGTRLFFEFKMVIEGMSPQNIGDICSAFDVKDPSEIDMYKSVSGNGGRSYLIEPKMSGGGAHLSLDCGSFVVHWHTLAFLLFSLPRVGGGRASVDLVMNW